MAKQKEDTESGFQSLLKRQIQREFSAAHQYLAVAIYFDTQHLPQMSQRFYAQSTEERSHALMMVQYLLDRDVDVDIKGVDPVITTFDSLHDAVELAVIQEKRVTEEITELTRAAREESDFLGERFMQWFLQEQVEEVASMTTLLAVVDQAAGNIFDLEAYVARETATTGAADPSAPKMAGGGT
ncbi:ferritin [Mycolicibacterium sp. Dal123E01]|uniref:ferritin n=1 Tax=Mycolicibacterium sp. Dal123E01 TaxID=3457578 RepID=UPI00403E468F